jgi:hypothetical protein
VERAGAGLTVGDKARAATTTDATMATIIVATEIATDIAGLTLSPAGSTPGTFLPPAKSISFQFRDARNWSPPPCCRAGFRGPNAGVPCADNASDTRPAFNGICRST